MSHEGKGGGSLETGDGDPRDDDSDERRLGLSPSWSRSWSSYLQLSPRHSKVSKSGFGQSLYRYELSRNVIENVDTVLQNEGDHGIEGRSSEREVRRLEGDPGVRPVGQP